MFRAGLSPSRNSSSSSLGAFHHLRSPSSSTIDSPSPDPPSPSPSPAKRQTRSSTTTRTTTTPSNSTTSITAAACKPISSTSKSSANSRTSASGASTATTTNSKQTTSSSTSVQQANLAARSASTLPSTPSKKRSAVAAASAAAAKASKSSTSSSPSKASSSSSSSTTSAGLSPSKAKAAEVSLTSDSADRSNVTVPTSDSTSSLSKQALTSTVEEPEEDEMDSTTSAAAAADTTTSVSPSKRQNVVVCVRVRPPPSGTSAGAGADEPELWKLDKETNKISPTEAHPSLAKRATSSAVAGGSGANASLLSSSVSMSDMSFAGGAAGAASETYKFGFDCLLKPGETTEAMYSSHIQPLVDSAVGGYNATVFAYGQTGSGKTHTMSGSKEEKGIIPRAVEQVFEGVEKNPSREFLLRVSYLEIYNETLKDLLAPLPAGEGAGAASEPAPSRPASPIKGGTSHLAGGSGNGAGSASNLRIIETAGNKVQVVGLREEIVTSSSTVLSLIDAGQSHRHQAATDWNERSSRSHCVFTITIESRPKGHSEGKEVRVSQLNLIDLAGSERAATNTDRRKEGAFINKSLLTLGTVIAKLSEASSSSDEGVPQHIPYRDSKLTRLLQTSLGGNARVAVVCTMSAAKEHAVESLSTLKFGKRCKMVVTQARRGTVMDDKALIAKYRRELDRLRAQLEAGGGGGAGDGSGGGGDVTMGDVTTGMDTRPQEEALEALEAQRQEAERDVAEMANKKASLKGQIEHLTRLILTSRDVVETSAPKKEEMNAPGTPRSRARMSDVGPASPLKRAIHQSQLASIPVQGSPAPPSLFPERKPFAVEAELASLRKELANSLAARQALEQARNAEALAWKAKVMQLEETVRSAEEELDEAEVAFDKVRAERDEARRKEVEAKRRAADEVEANRLLKLVAQAKTVRESPSTPNPSTAAEELEATLRERQQRFESEKEELRKAHEQELETLQAKLQETERHLEEERLAKEEAIREASETNRERGDEDAERDFQQLVRGADAGVEGEGEGEANSRALAERKEELDRREAELEKRQAELEGAHSSSQRNAEHLEAKLAASQEQLAAVQASLDAARSSSSALAEQQRLREAAEAREQRLKAEMEGHRARVAALERKLVENSGCKHKPLPVPSTNGAGPAPTSCPGSPRKYDRFGALVGDDEGQGGSGGVQRAGSVREYRRYGRESSEALPSRLRSIAGDLSSLSSGPDTTALEASLRYERDEVERLNNVIAIQRSIMADLEKSVAGWKARLKAQQDIIRRLVESNGDTSGMPASELFVGSPALTDSVNSATTSTTAPASALGSAFGNRGAAVLSASARGNTPGREPAWRPLSSVSTNAPASPYYGAHIYNRPPPNTGLGLHPPSPTKSTASSGWSGLPTATQVAPSNYAPEPLPLPISTPPVTLLAAPQARKTRRKTIDREIAALRDSPRVESTRSRLLDNPVSRTSPMPSSPTRSAGGGRPLPVPGAGPPTSSRDWYI